MSLRLSLTPIVLPSLYSVHLIHSSTSENVCILFCRRYYEHPPTIIVVLLYIVQHGKIDLLPSLSLCMVRSTPSPVKPELLPRTRKAIPDEKRLSTSPLSSPPRTLSLSSYSLHLLESQIKPRPESIVTMCQYDLVTYLQCRHDEFYYVRGCPRSYHQLMRIHDPNETETGVPFDWADECQPRTGRNENVRRIWQMGVCGSCRMVMRAGVVYRGFGGPGGY